MAEVGVMPLCKPTQVLGESSGIKIAKRSDRRGMWTAAVYALREQESRGLVQHSSTLHGQLN